MPRPAAWPMWPERCPRRSAASVTTSGWRCHAMAAWTIEKFGLARRLDRAAGADGRAHGDRRPPRRHGSAPVRPRRRSISWTAPRYFDRQGIYMYPDDAERFIFFSRAALEACRALDWQPDVIHCNEWHTALVPNWLKTIYRDDPFFAQHCDHLHGAQPRVPGHLRLSGAGDCRAGRSRLHRPS